MREKYLYLINLFACNDSKTEEVTPNSDVTIKNCLKRLLKYANAFQEMVLQQVNIIFELKTLVHFRHNHKIHCHLDGWPWYFNVRMPKSRIMIDLESAYMNDGRELLNKNYPDCSFYLHSTCVSITKNIFEDADSSCLPGCTEYSIHQESIHVSFSFTTPI